MFGIGILLLIIIVLSIIFHPSKGPQSTEDKNIRISNYFVNNVDSCSTNNEPNFHSLYIHNYEELNANLMTHNLDIEDDYIYNCAKLISIKDNGISKIDVNVRECEIRYIPKNESKFGIN